MQGRSIAAKKECSANRSSASQLSVYTVTIDLFSTVCFAGASTIRVTPITTKKATPINSVRGIRLREACTAITEAREKLDHAEKAIRLRCPEGLREASSRKMPSVA